MKSFVILAAISSAISASTLLADTESSAGGWGVNCHADTVYCNSGRQLNCRVFDVRANERSICTDHHGDVGWVLCEAFDDQGNLLSRTLEQCP